MNILKHPYEAGEAPIPSLLNESPLDTSDDLLQQLVYFIIGHPRRGTENSKYENVPIRLANELAEVYEEDPWKGSTEDDTATSASPLS